MPCKALGPVDKGYESHGRFKQGKVHQTDTLAYKQVWGRVRLEVRGTSKDLGTRTERWAEGDE